jgi:hypothetical protein
MIELKGFKFKTNINEFTIREYENITEIIAKDDANYIEKWLNVFEILGADKEVISKLTDEDLFAYIDEMNIEVLPSPILKKKIKIGDREWFAFEGDSFKLKLRDLSYIEKLLKEPTNYFAKVLAIIFKDPLLDNNYDIDIINERAELFNELIVGDYMNYITYVIEKITKKISIINEPS